MAAGHHLDVHSREPGVHRICAHIVLGLSLFAMTLVVGATAVTLAYGRRTLSPDGDEGTAAHLFQLAIVLLVPACITFLVTADWNRPSRLARRAVLPAAALVVAFATLYYMEHLR